MQRRLTLIALVAACSLACADFAQAQNAADPNQPAQSAQTQTQPDQTPQAQPGQAQNQQGQNQQPQNQPQVERRNSIAPSNQAGMARSADAELAACLIVGNEGEVAAAQFALSKTQNDEVKKFAEMMIKDHGQMIEKLRPFAGNLASAGNAATVDRQSGALDHVAFKRELGEKCKQTMQRELGQKSGAEFDECFIDAQIGAHLHAIDAMQVAQNHSSPELQKVLEEGIQTSSAHLQHAKDLAKQMESAK